MNQALVLSSKGLAWSETPQPSITDPHEALVRPIAVTLCDVDVRMLSGELPVHAPTVLGHEGVGRVVEVGAQVSRLKKGDRVIGAFVPSCGACWFCQHEQSELCEREMAVSTRPLSAPAALIPSA